MKFLNFRLNSRKVAGRWKPSMVRKTKHYFLKCVINVHIHIYRYMYVCTYKYLYLNCEPYKENTWARDPIFHPIVTFHFILTGKPGSGWEKSIVNSGNLSKLKKASMTLKTFFVSRIAGLPNSSHIKNITRECVQDYILFSIMFIWDGRLNDMEMIWILIWPLPTINHPAILGLYILSTHSNSVPYLQHLPALTHFCFL